MSKQAVSFYSPVQLVAYVPPVSFEKKKSDNKVEDCWRAVPLRTGMDESARASAAVGRMPEARPRLQPI